MPVPNPVQVKLFDVGYFNRALFLD